MENYGKIDILWYDVPLPLQTHEGWQSLALNQMVRKLQPDILINDRSYLPEDFSTPEESVVAAEAGRGWEACMTFNHTSWGHMPSASQDSYTARDIVKMLNIACNGRGNLLLNIGPTPAGGVPEEAVEPLMTVGKWLTDNSEAVYGKLDIAPTRNSGCSRGPTNLSATGSCSQKGNKIYLWCRCWPGSELTIGGFETKLKNARFLVNGKTINFSQESSRVFLKDMPKDSPDTIVGITVIELEFFAPPVHRKYARTDVFQVWRS
jgi:alpha-L-fucosidase